MKIIRDEEGSGIFMIPLFVDWGVKRCNVKGCTEKPTTILADLGPGVPIAGMCELHFQEGKQQVGTSTFSFVWDDFDAFKAREVPDAAEG